MHAYAQSESNVKKTWILMVSFFALLSLLGYSFGYFLGDNYIMIYTMVFALAWTFGSYFLADRVALKIAGARKADTKNPKELMATRLVDNLSISQGMHTPRVFVIDDKAMNAFATGRGEENATIVFTTGLLNSLEKIEIEGVAAHELSHIKNKDIMIMTISVALIGVIALISDTIIRMAVYSDGKKHPAMYVAVIVLGVLSPIAAKLIHLSISRKREFLADASAALMTRYPEGLSSALKKISQQKTSMKKKSTAIAHLYISSPERKKKGGSGMMERFFSTHPPIQERIEALEKM